ncbi:MAG: gliding motility-associated C-terminal domain-containing protein [Bacteroidota bacterium]
MQFFNRHLILLVFTLFSFYSNPAKAQTDVSDSLALVALYNSTNGPGWTDNTNWLTGTVDTWYGIFVDGSRVSSLNLNYNNLVGTIPADLGNLTSLTSLSLTGNQLSGSIPPELGALANLSSLNLNDNQLSGSIPPELGNLTGLMTLSLSINQLIGSIPEELTNITMLYEFYFEATSLCEPTSTAYTTWKAGIMNYFGTGLICETLAVDSLAMVALYNSTNGPGWINNSNWLTGPINTWHGITMAEGRVTGVEICNNNLLGSIPEEIGNLTELGSLGLCNNLLSGTIPTTLGGLIRLKSIDFDDNQLTGTIPVEIGSLDSLKNLILSINSLSGPIPAELGNLSLLEQLILHNNNLTGTVPETLINIPNLIDFGFGGNDLCEPTSTAYTNWAAAIPNYSGTNIPCAPDTEREALIALYNATNGLAWTNSTNWNTANSIDTWAGVTVDDNGRVTGINLSNNNLSGSIPSEIGNLAELRHIDLSYNLLTGSIPVEIGNLTNLGWLSLLDNQLTGSIPDEIGNLINLTGIFIWDNQLSGTIPASFGNLTKLEYLVLPGNQLTGSLPPELENCASLKNIELHVNNLSGTIPEGYVNLSNLATFAVGYNEFEGAIPEGLTRLPHLYELYIAHCNFTDLPAFPATTDWGYFHVQGNKFTFKDILPNLPNFAEVTQYAPQKPLGDSISISGYTYEPLRIDPFIAQYDGQQYRWLKDGVSMGLSNNHYYDIDEFLDIDAGVYELEVTHPDVPGLILTRAPIIVNAKDGDPPKPYAVEIISPNGDGINDEMTITNIELYPEHRVLIYDVLGRLVYSTEDYDNINNPFIGIGNINGFGELPSGTYYYVIDVGSIRKNGKGYFVMKRN